MLRRRTIVLPLITVCLRSTTAGTWTLGCGPTAPWRASATRTTPMFGTDMTKWISTRSPSVLNTTLKSKHSFQKGPKLPSIVNRALQQDSLSSRKVQCFVANVMASAGTREERPTIKDLNSAAVDVIRGGCMLSKIVRPGISRMPVRCLCRRSGSSTRSVRPALWVLLAAAGLADPCRVRWARRDQARLAR